MIDRSDAADSRLPTLANDPTENADSADPTDPIDSTDPIDPIDSTEPRDPMLKNESVERIEKREPSSIAPLSDITTPVARRRLTPVIRPA